MNRASLLARGFDIPVPPHCHELIESGALVALSTSGGKDSQAMTVLLSRLVPLDQLVMVHAPLRPASAIHLSWDSNDDG